MGGLGLRADMLAGAARLAFKTLSAVAQSQRRPDMKPVRTMAIALLLALETAACYSEGWSEEVAGRATPVGRTDVPGSETA